MRDSQEFFKGTGFASVCDGRGRFLDNIFIERLWWSLKYELLYIQEFVSVPELGRGLSRWFEAYNRERFHQALGYKTPDEVYEFAQPV